jgi:hypothetical protein
MVAWLNMVEVVAGVPRPLLTIMVLVAVLYLVEEVEEVEEVSRPLICKLV